ncbi:MAG TPA: DUF4398 domain-containing protein [Steroidobacteraceae bacterium]
MSVRSGFLLAAGTAAFLATGCASNAERPTAAMTRAETIISQAERADAQRYAAVELQQARDKLRRADDAADDKNNRMAERLAEEAVADAEYAMAKTAAARTQASAEEVRRSVETLEQEAERPPVAQ